MTKLGGTNVSVDTDLSSAGLSGEDNTASNVGTGGVGVFKQKTGVDLEFKKINSTTGVKITDDTGNNEIDVELDINALTADATPDAAADFVLTYDASAGVHKKVQMDDLPTGSAVFSGALVKSVANQSVSSSTDTLLIFGGETYDTDDWHDNSTNNTRMTVPTGVTRVRLTAGWRDTSSVAGQFIIRMLKNGSSFPGNPIQESDTAGGDACSIASPVVDCVATDYFEVQVFCVNSRTIEADDGVFFSIEKVS